VAITVTQEALEVLRRSLEMGGVDTSTGGVRLRGAHGLGGGMDVQVELADGAIEGETVVEESGLRLFVDPGIEKTIPNALVALEPQHEIIVVRPAQPPEHA
jgi:Fe-S cluster assembly iron-binding protein IscA